MRVKQLFLDHHDDDNDVLFLSLTPSYLEDGPAAGENALAPATNNVNAPTENFILLCIFRQLRVV